MDFFDRPILLDIRRHQVKQYLLGWTTNGTAFEHFRVLYLAPRQPVLARDNICRKRRYPITSFHIHLDRKPSQAIFVAAESPECDPPGIQCLLGTPWPALAYLDLSWPPWNPRISPTLSGKAFQSHPN
jgi:hypothetical protein